MILTIDYGTTNLKAALIDKKGAFHNYYSEEVSPLSNKDIHEINTKVYIDFLLRYLKKINKNLIESIIISSNGPSILSLYSEININNNKINLEYSNTRLWMDKRGKNYSKIVSQYYQTYIDGSFFLPSILSIKENEIDSYNKTKYFLTIDSFINYFLTKKAYIVNNANLLKKYYWDENSLKYFNLSQDKFPQFIDCGEIISTIDENIANTLELSSNIKIIAGGSDFYFSLIGSNITNENILADINGTSEGVNLCIKNYIKDKRFLCYEHPLKGYYNLSGVISNSGIALNWIREILDIDISDFEDLYKLAENSNRNNTIFLPYLTGERAPIWNSQATGSFINLTNETKREELAMSVIEATIFSFKSVIDSFEELGCLVNEIHTSTKKNNMDFYYQLKSDITNKKIVVYKTISLELLGLAILAYKTSEKIDIRKHMEQNSKIYTPNIKNQKYYENKYNLFNKLYSTLKPIMNKKF